MPFLRATPDQRIFSAHGLDPGLIDPYIEQTIFVFDNMLNWRLDRKTVSVKKNYAPTYEVSGIIGLSGDVSGVVALSFSQDLACRMLSELLGVEIFEIDDEVVDMVGEIVNTLAGRATSEMVSYDIGLSLPTVLVGGAKSIGFPRESTPFAVEFTTPWGPIALEIGLAMVDLRET